MTDTFSQPIPEPETGPPPFIAETEHSEAEARALSAHHLASLIFLSYRLSQGAIGTQNRILLYVEEHGQPDLFNGPEAAEVRAMTRKMVGPYFLNQKLHPATAVPWEDDTEAGLVKTETIVTNELAGLFERFEDRDLIDGFDSDTVGICASFIVMDHDYLTRPSGRAGDSHELKVVVGPYLRDAYDSTFIKYGLLGSSTKAAEFDEMFQQLASEEVILQLDAHTLKLLHTIITIYIREHPEAEQDERIVRCRTICEKEL